LLNVEALKLLRYLEGEGPEEYPGLIVDLLKKNRTGRSTTLMVVSVCEKKVGMVVGFDDCDLLDLRRVVRSPAPSVDCLRQEALCNNSQFLLFDDDLLGIYNTHSSLGT
jgi:hypothetical protein